MIGMGEQIIEHLIMECPVCGQRITARVVVAVEARAAVDVDVDGGALKVNVKADSELLRFHITHSCPGRTEAVAADPEVVEPC